jgi:hypothetical protein
MISLGASSVVGQAAAGLILTYTRTLRPGEFVRIGEHEGTVTEMGMFTTRIRTGLGEVLTIPNAMITGSVTKNYSRTVQGAGYIVDTTVTIGYDTPWRQVEAMLLEAALRTPGILPRPVPQVFQTALSDFYPEYRLVAQASPSEPLSRAQLLSMLHANIQDVFNEYGVQIMSPHYLGDPQQEKCVPKARWYARAAAEGTLRRPQPLSAAGRGQAPAHLSPSACRPLMGRIMTSNSTILPRSSKRIRSMALSCRSPTRAELQHHAEAIGAGQPRW